MVESKDELLTSSRKGDKTIYVCDRCGSTIIALTRANGLIRRVTRCVFSGRSCSGQLRKLEATNSRLRAGHQWVEGEKHRFLVLKEWKRNNDRMTAGQRSVFNAEYVKLKTEAKAEVEAMFGTPRRG